MSDLGLGIKGSPLPNKEVLPEGDPVEEIETLQKLKDIELLPDLFTLMQSLEKGDLQPKDFDNNAGNIRLKVNTVRQYLQEIDGICETVAERKSKIQAIRQSNEKKVEFLGLFREKVLKDLGET